MELQTAEHKIVKMLEKQNAQEAINEIKELFSNISPEELDIKKQLELEESLDYILEKYNLRQIAINIFNILEKTYTIQEKNYLASMENFQKTHNTNQ